MAKVRCQIKNHYLQLVILYFGHRLIELVVGDEKRNYEEILADELSLNLIHLAFHLELVYLIELCQILNTLRIALTLLDH